MAWTGTRRLAVLQSASYAVHITGSILAKLGKTGPHSTFVSTSSLVQSDQFQGSPCIMTFTVMYSTDCQLHGQLNHCQLLSKRVSSTVMLLTCIRKVYSSNFGRRTDSTDVSRGFTQSFLEISLGHLPNVLLFQFISSVVK
jgi:hypothetical protein